MLVYYCNELLALGYMHLEFQSNRDSCKFLSRFLFTLGCEAISRKSVKNSYIADSTMEVEYVVAFEVAKEVVNLASKVPIMTWGSALACTVPSIVF